MKDVKSLSTAEESVRDYLSGLRGDGRSTDDEGFVREVVRTARWQRAARQPLRVAGAVLSALGDGVRLLVGGR